MSIGRTWREFASEWLVLVVCLPATDAELNNPRHHSYLYICRKPSTSFEILVEANQGRLILLVHPKSENEEAGARASWLALVALLEEKVGGLRWRETSPSLGEVRDGGAHKKTIIDLPVKHKHSH